MSLFRKFPIIGERLGGELRFESFNFTNTPHFSNPSGDFGGASFKEVTGAAADQRTIRFALKIIFLKEFARPAKPGQVLMRPGRTLPALRVGKLALSQLREDLS